LLSVTELSAGYGRTQVLREISLEVAPGESVAILGPNGAGKTTLLRALSGMIRPSAGRIEMRGTSVAGLPPHRLVRYGIAHVPEGRRLFGSMTVEENLRMGAYARSAGEVADQLARVLAVFPEIEVKLSQPARSLSGGQQQMVAVGRALMARPSVLLLDEPTTGLAPIIVTQLMEALGELRRSMDTALLLVEQDLSVARRVADRLYVLNHGSVQASVPAAEVDREAVLASYLGETA
jgi:branched-chain amino acid transport system ATP-binding protein